MLATIDRVSELRVQLTLVEEDQLVMMSVINCLFSFTNRCFSHHSIDPAVLQDSMNSCRFFYGFPLHLIRILVRAIIAGA